MRHLLSTKDLSHEEAVLLLDTTAAMAATQGREIKKLPTLRGRTVVNLFFEDSTRTRISFETAAKRLSADVINFSAKGSSVSKGESLKDTALTLKAMGADAVVVRHHASGAPHFLAQPGLLDVPVINAGDGTHQHPTQALLDAFTLRRHLANTSANPGQVPGVDAGVGHDLAGRKNRDCWRCASFAGCARKRRVVSYVRRSRDVGCPAHFGARGGPYVAVFGLV